MSSPCPYDPLCPHAVHGYPCCREDEIRGRERAEPAPRPPHAVQRRQTTSAKPSLLGADIWEAWRGGFPPRSRTLTRQE